MRFPTGVLGGGVWGQVQEGGGGGVGGSCKNEGKGEGSGEFGGMGQGPAKKPASNAQALSKLPFSKLPLSFSPIQPIPRVAPRRRFSHNLGREHTSESSSEPTPRNSELVREFQRNAKRAIRKGATSKNVKQFQKYSSTLFRNFRAAPIFQPFLGWPLTPRAFFKIGA